MKTPMQEHIEWLKEEIEAYALLLDVKKVEALTLAKEHTESMLEKEKEIICNAMLKTLPGAVVSRRIAEQYFEETFNTKEK